MAERWARMEHIGTWWEARTPGEKRLLAAGAGVLGIGLGCAVATHGVLIVTSKAVIAVGPVAKTLAKALVVSA